MENGIYAKFTTPKGEILVKLTHDKTPGTVGNFVALAEGNLENTARTQGKPYYDGLTFHRVIADFMLQGTVTTIVDTEGKQQVRTYQVDMQLIDLETNKIIWADQNNDIRKYIKRPSAKF